MSWTVRRLGWDLLIVQEDNPDIDIASMTERLNWEANAHLIAAAPDLLAAAEAVLNDAYMPDLISGGHVCLNCNFNLNSGEHHAECPIPALAAAIKKAKGQSVTELDGGHATAILECSSVKTREEIEKEYQNNVEILYIEFGDNLREVAEVRDAALAELDDPALALAVSMVRGGEDFHAAGCVGCDGIKRALEGRK